MASAPAKRKHEHPELSHRKRRRVEAMDARVVSAQTSGKAFGNGEVDVEAFVRAREFEIKALQESMNKSKKVLTLRAFQQVPRHLRRRTASHNPSRVPKRLRARAMKEMRQDNTPIKKRKALTARMRLRLQNAKSVDRSRRLLSSNITRNNKEIVREDGLSKPKGLRIKKNRLLKPPYPQAKFRKRQIHKTWLPTHLFHAKRAHMTTSNAPLWRMAIPLSPTEKIYRPVHRATTSRGAIAWDMSYISTIGLEGNVKSILEIYKKLGVGCNQRQVEANRWIAGSRFWQGWLHKPGSTKDTIAPVQVAWIAASNYQEVEITKRKKERRCSFLRVHPCAFLEVWEILLDLCKSQKPAVGVTDLRFEIGSIDLIGPSSTEALAGVLHPCLSDEMAIDKTLWPLLACVNDTSSLPANVVVSMDITDPRLSARICNKATRQNPAALTGMLSHWPWDERPPISRLFETAHRRKASRQMPSQRAVNRRKSAVALGKDPEPLATDPQIPVMMLASRHSLGGCSGWTVLLPWKCLRVIWYCLMYRPLLHGGHVIFGGLDEQRQVAYEQGTPWFPADFPATKAGMAWEEMQRTKRKKESEKQPKSKRVEWESLDLGQGRKGEIGQGWACDWEELLRFNGNINSQLSLERISPDVALKMLRGYEPLGPNDARSSLVVVKVEMLFKGVPNECARIYRLPQKDTEARQKWLSLRTKPSSTSRVQRSDRHPAKDHMASHIQQQQLAASLLGIGTDADQGQEAHPPIPDEEDLIGFITTGAFNLEKGKGMGIGSILLHKILTTSRAEDSKLDSHLCIIRNVGQNVGRLAKWQLAP